MTDQFDMLAAYACGTASPGAALIVASQLTLRPENRAIVASMEEVGGAVLASEPQSAEQDADARMSDGALDRALSMLDDAPCAAATPAAARESGPAAGGPLPGPVLDAVGVRFDDIPWRRRLRGVHEHVMGGFGSERVSLLRAAPGVRIPHHTHSGLEATLVLAGRLNDNGVEMTAGDLSLCGPEDDHHPEIIGDELCYCLVVVEGSLRFRTGLGRAFRFF